MNPGEGQCQLGSLTGAVSSQRVTEELKGTLSLVGNQAASVKVEECLTARPISRAGAKAGLSDPAVLDGKAVAQFRSIPISTNLDSRTSGVRESIFRAPPGATLA